MSLSCGHLSQYRRAYKKRNVLSPQSRGDSLQDERRFIGKVKAIRYIG